MDYPNRQRIKIWGTAHAIEDDQNLLDNLAPPDYNASVERAILIKIEAWDANCPQHITPRLTQQEWESKNGNNR
jgi:hypothetical protein